MPARKRFKMFLRILEQYLVMVAGALLMAAAFNLFLIPNKIVSGGASGLAIVAFYLTGGFIPVGVGILIINIPLFVIAFIKLGYRLTVKTLVAVVVLSAAIDLTRGFTENIVAQFLNAASVGSSATDMTLYAVFGGVFLGAGLGFVLLTGGTTGGSDLVAKLYKSGSTGMSIGTVLFIVDTFVIVVASFAFRSFLLGMYALISLYATSRVIDAIVEGVNYSKAVYIISSKSREIAERILSELDRGATGLKGYGMYTGIDRDIIFCVVKRAQLPDLKRIAREIDRDVFIVVSEAREVLGNGFNN